MLATIMTVGMSIAHAVGFAVPIQTNTPPPTDRLIIKYRDQSAQTQSAQALGDSTQRLSAMAGAPLTFHRAMSGGAQVLRLSGKVSHETAVAMARRIASDPTVEYAEPDAIMRPLRVPSDPGFSAQWNYYEAGGGINLPAAWDISTGASNIVVAVIDTGYRPHVDLAGRILPGYDFINDVAMANDGNGRDPDASDPGDWITAAESSNPAGPFYGCPVGNSSWHGTHVAGTIGAATNNGGVAGINWMSKILPVRVLGKCGGYVSDIADGMRWAAGLAVPGIPANPNPAQVQNLSLGGRGTCSTTYQNAVNDIVAAGKIVVVAAGNSSSDVTNFQPASCNGVFAVAATNRSGDKAWYSNFGSKIAISAPGGDTSVSAANGVLSTLNAGITTPGADNYVYYQGTSMSAPHVTGVVSLMLSVNPVLTPAQVLQRLQASARPFPPGSGCNTAICGAGIIDAGAAVRAAQPPSAADWLAPILNLLLND